MHGRRGRRSPAQHETGIFARRRRSALRLDAALSVRRSAAELAPLAVSASAGVGRDQVQVGVPLQEVSRVRNGDDDAGASLAATREPDQLLNGLGPRRGQLREQLTATPEQRTQQARDGQDDVAVGGGRKDLLAQPLGPEGLLLLLARRDDWFVISRDDYREGKRRPAAASSSF
jgi:hypothetical protein